MSNTFVLASITSDRTLLDRYQVQLRFRLVNKIDVAGREVKIDLVLTHQELNDLLFKTRKSFTGEQFASYTWVEIGILTGVMT